ncbi:MAG TPA: hypothetical protein VJR28_05140, partial [Chthoniobacterales bacterium]|nr:hypothetical protein [Chthoniobacterales bacterium]
MQKKGLTFHLLTGETFISSRNGREENEAEKIQREVNDEKDHNTCNPERCGTDAAGLQRKQF